MTERRVYNVPEVAALLGLSPWSVFQHVKDGTFPIAPIRVGRRILFSALATDRLIDGEVAQ